MNTPAQTDKAITSIQYRNKGGGGAGGDCAADSTLEIYGKDGKIFSASVGEIINTVNEHAALCAVAEAAKEMWETVAIIDGQMTAFPYRKTIEALDALSAARKGAK